MLVNYEDDRKSVCKPSQCGPMSRTRNFDILSNSHLPRHSNTLNVGVKIFCEKSWSHFWKVSSMAYFVFVMVVYNSPW